MELWRAEGTFPSFEDEGDAIPSFVFDVKRYGCKSGTSAIFGDSIVLQVAWFTSISNILSNNHVFRINRWNRPQHTDLPLVNFCQNTHVCGCAALRLGWGEDLFITNILCAEGDGSFHCNEREDLQ